MGFRYEYRYNHDLSNAKGVRIQFMKDFPSVDGVEGLANYPHKARRDWATSLLNKYRYKLSRKTKLDDSDFGPGYGACVKAEYPDGATISIIEPNLETQDVILVIQVDFILFIKIVITDDVKNG